MDWSWKTYVMIWASAHRSLIILVLGLSMWVAAYYWYFKDELQRYLKEGRAHKWSVDMQTRSVKGGRKRVE